MKRPPPLETFEWTLSDGTLWGFSLISSLINLSQGFDFYCYYSFRRRTIPPLRLRWILIQQSTGSCCAEELSRLKGEGGSRVINICTVVGFVIIKRWMGVRTESKNKRSPEDTVSYSVSQKYFRNILFLWEAHRTVTNLQLPWLPLVLCTS